MDESTTTTYYLDADGDGNGSTSAIQSCAPQAGYVANNFDCDDSNAALNANDVDLDFASSCAGDCDDNNASLNLNDNDGDGFSTCTNDCDDNDADLNPVDNDGDGFSSCTGDCDDTDSSLTPNDNDGDGFSSCAGDCDDTDATVNSIDLDGDGYSACTNDCDDTDASLNPADLDGDGFSSCAGDCDDANPVLNLLDSDNDGFSTCAGDCNDSDASINSSANEVCDGVDNDCDGDVDDADVSLDSNTTTTYYLDADGDGNGSTNSIQSCASPPGYVTNSSDCDDDNAALNINDVDADGFSSCSGDCDDSDASLNLSDVDNDGFSTCAGDCNDQNSLINSNSVEVCDGFDNDCDGFIDDADISLDGSSTTTYYLDSDGDGNGSNTSIQSCLPVLGYVVNNADCDDGDASLNANDVDNDGFSTCAGDCDDAVAALTPADLDGDGFSSCTGDCDDSDSVVSPADNDNDGFTGCGGDCDDQSDEVYPNATEIPDDNIDQDCDGTDVSCANPLTDSWSVSFPAIDSCDWGENDNGPPTQGALSARTEQLTRYTTTPDAPICDIRVSLQASQGGDTFQNFGYNDQVILSYNGYLMFSTTTSVLPSLSLDGTGYLYNWSDMFGSSMSFTADVWADGTNSSLSFPDPSYTTTGIAVVEMDDDFMQELHQISIDTGELEFMLSTLGDNDDAGSTDGADCFHTGMFFGVEVDLAQ